MKKLRVMHVIPNFGSGGAERLAADLVKFSNRGLFEFVVCSLYSKQGYFIKTELEQSGATVCCLKKHPGPDLSVIAHLWEVIKRFSPDVIHTHLSVIKYVLAPALLNSVKIKVHTIHSSPGHEVGFFDRVINRFAFSYCNVVPVSLSEALRVEFERLYKFNNSRVIFNGVDIKKFNVNAQERARVRQKLGIENKRAILHAGRFTKAKNHKLLIDIFAQVKKVNKDALLLLAGNGELRPQIEERVKELGIGDSVFFMGAREDIRELFAAADLFVLTSDWEGMPLTVLEAMASGLPVVVSDVGSAREIVKDGVSGFLFPAKDAPSAVSRILELLSNSRLYSEFSDNAKNQVKQFDITQTAKKYEDLYIELFEKYSKAGAGHGE